MIETQGQIYIDVRHKKEDDKTLAIVVIGIEDNGSRMEALLPVENAREHFHGVMKACQKAQQLMMTEEDRTWSEALMRELEKKRSEAEQRWIEDSKLETRIYDAVANAASILSTEGYSAEATELQDAIGAFFGFPKEEGEE